MKNLNYLSFSWTLGEGVKMISSHRTTKKGYTLIRYFLSGIAMNVSMVRKCAKTRKASGNMFL